MELKIHLMLTLLAMKISSTLVLNLQNIAVFHLWLQWLLEDFAKILLLKLKNLILRKYLLVVVIEYHKNCKMILL